MHKQQTASLQVIWIYICDYLPTRVAVTPRSFFTQSAFEHAGSDAGVNKESDKVQIALPVVIYFLSGAVLAKQPASDLMVNEQAVCLFHSGPKGKIRHARITRWAKMGRGGFISTTRPLKTAWMTCHKLIRAPMPSLYRASCEALRNSAVIAAHPPSCSSNLAIKRGFVWSIWSVVQ